jgi:hypothetical protein
MSAFAVTLSISAEVGVALNISMDVGVALSISAGALSRCISVEVGDLPLCSCSAALAAFKNSATLVGVARNTSEGIEEGAARKISAEGVADLMYSVLAPRSARKNMSADGVKERWAWPSFFDKLSE